MSAETMMSDEMDHSDSSDDDESNEHVIAEARVLVSEQPWNYDVHAKLLDVLRKAGEFDELNLAREAMSAMFPLPEGMWLQWANDAVSMALNLEMKTTALQLYERALKDYISVDVWLAYLNQAILLLDDIEHTRMLFERAVESAGSHYVCGTKLWSAYRQFEETTGEGHDTRVQALYERELALPLRTMQAVFEEYTNKVKTASDKILATRPQVLAACQARELIESKIATAAAAQPMPIGYANAECLEEWQKYLQSETNLLGKSHPNFVLALFERALSTQFLMPQLWMQYHEFLIIYSPNIAEAKHLLVTAMKRAVRNCPNHCKLWVLNLRGMFEAGKELSIIEEAASRAMSLVSAVERVEIYMVMSTVYARSLSVLFQPDQAAHLRQQLQSSLTYAWECVTAHYDEEKAINYYSFYVDAAPLLELSREQTRELFEKLIQVNPAVERSWTKFIAFERLQGSGAAHQIYKRALVSLRHLSIRDTLGQEWLAYESVHGPPGGYADACRVIHEVSAAVLLNTAKSKKPAPSKKKKENKKRKMDDSKKKNQDDAKPTKKSKTHKEQDTSTAPNSTQRPPVQPAEHEEKKKKKKKDDEANNAAKVAFDDDRTAFVLGIGQDSTEESIKAVFAKCGTIQEVRIPRTNKGFVKGFAYVEYADPQDVVKAVQKFHQTDLDGHIISVSPQKEAKDHKHQSKNEMDRTIFVKKIPAFSDTVAVEKFIRDTFEQCGPIEEIRLAFNRDGTQKRFCYIEFEDKSAIPAALAVTNISVTDKKTGDSREWHVEVSQYNPDSAKDKVAAKRAKQAAKLEKAAVATTKRKPTKLNIVGQAPRKKKSANIKTVATASTSEATNAKPMSNDDFRNLFLKK